MTNPKSAVPIIHNLSHASLGTRRHPTLAPRPLHNPMDDHAIVLYDPTIDDRPAPEDEAAELLLAEEKKIAEIARGPHKSLKTILGIVDETKKKDVKVPVVIDPRLTKVLRPHQIEGVKVSTPRGAELITVLISLYYWTPRQKRLGMHHGR
jgi:DNA repair and recombination RAD54-like protein